MISHCKIVCAAFGRPLHDYSARFLASFPKIVPESITRKRPSLDQKQGLGVDDVLDLLPTSDHAIEPISTAADGR